MKSELCQWLNDLSDVAARENVIVEAKYIDGLEYFHRLKLSPEEALPKYKKLVQRVTAIEGQHRLKQQPVSEEPEETAEDFKHIQSFADDNFQWTETVFPGETLIGKLKHLQKEVVEAIRDVEVSADPSQLLFEFADIYLLLLNSAKKAGFSFSDIHKAAVSKMEINRSRKWGKPNEDGFIEHVKEEGK